MTMGRFPEPRWTALPCKTFSTEVDSGKIDIIVVYKVDRLTRSLADFAKLVELFDQHSVSFVSVTQSFNTTSSMGRLTLNVLLSFAQFEREVIGERVRDKIAASKAKGIWVGGSVPLGYASVNKKLVVVPEEAETVRFIFRRYLELGSIRDPWCEDLDRKGDSHSAPDPFDRPVSAAASGSALAHSPTSCAIGSTSERSSTVAPSTPANRKPILDRDLFDAVQAKLTASANTRQLKLKASPSVLAGRIFDDRGNRMTPTHTNKQGARYRYYVSHAILQKRVDEAGSVPRVPAHDIETKVLNALRDHLGEGSNGAGRTPMDDRAVIEQLVDRITIKLQAIEIHLKCESEPQVGGYNRDDESYLESNRRPPSTLTVPWSAAASAEVKGILHSPSPAPTVSSESCDLMLTAIAKARAWIDDLVEGRVASFAEIADQEGKVERHVRFLAPLAFVSPLIVSAIAERSMPELNVTDLAKAAVYSWAEQGRRFGL